MNSNSGIAEECLGTRGGNDDFTDVIEGWVGNFP